MSIELATSRVVVIDDNADEATPLIRALARLNVGPIYLTGGIEEKDVRLNGIRLAFVDLNLMPQGDDDEQIDNTVGFLSNILSGSDDSPLVVCIWTSKMEMRDQFEKKLHAVLPNSAVRVVLPLDKNIFDLNRDIPKIVQHIDAGLSSLHSLRLQWTWENMVHNAVSHTTHVLSGTISEISKPNANVAEWDAGAFKVFSNLSRGALGSGAQDPKKSAAGVFESLNKLLEDRLDASGKWLSVADEAAQKISDGAEKGKISNLSLMRRAKLETMLHVGQPSSDNLSSGQMFLLDQRPNPLLRRLCGIERNLIEATCAPKEQGSMPVAFVVTPACDVAQKKSLFCQLALGLAIPATSTKSSSAYDKNRDFVKCFGPFILGEKPKKWPFDEFFLAICSHFTISITAEKATTLHAFGRLREPAMADLHHWLANMQHRLGYITLQ